MDEASAREYSESLGQIGAGVWRQIAWADGQGIPAALGLTTREWVGQFLGGYMRIALEERREAVKELANGTRSHQKIGDILGVSDETVRRDLATSVANTPGPEPEAATSVANRTDLPLTREQAEKWPHVVTADLRAELTQALYSFGKPGKFEPDEWAERLPQLRPDDVALIRQQLGYIRRWLEKWDRLLDRPALSVIGRSPE